MLFIVIEQELTEHKYKSETLIHELSSKLNSVEEVSVFIYKVQLSFTKVQESQFSRKNIVLKDIQSLCYIHSLSEHLRPY